MQPTARIEDPHSRIGRAWTVGISDRRIKSGFRARQIVCVNVDGAKRPNPARAGEIDVLRSIAGREP